MGFFEKLKEGLRKTKQAIFNPIDELCKRFVRIDEDFFDELEEILVTADVGITTTEEVLDALREQVRNEKIKDPSEIRAALQNMLCADMGEAVPLQMNTKPAVILFIGVNGVGKTTSVGKVAGALKEQGKQVLVAAADTFRAAATEQLTVWCERAGVPIVKQGEGADPAAVVYDAIQATKSRNADVLLIDTAGRLHNKKNLMDELAKIHRVILRELPDCDVETLLVLDATTGQNALLQAKEFSEVAPITGLVLTKLDGTAKGGVVLAIYNELKIPVKFVGVGEKIGDMRPFEPQEFIKALFAVEEA